MEEKKVENQGPYSGFMLIACEECGQVAACCVKKPTYSFKCRGCGERTLLENLRRAYLNCEKCGFSAFYKTNLTGESLEHVCLNCGARIRAVESTGGTAYVTVGADGKKVIWKDRR